MILFFTRCLVFFLLTLVTGSLHAQDVDRLVGDEPLHWAFASLLGTGWYRVDGSQKTFIIQGSYAQPLRESDLDENGKRDIGVYVRYDGTAGFHDIEGLIDFPDADQFSSLSFSPGVELEIPVNSDWYLRPFANFGWGTALDADVSAWIYYAGVKSRFRFGQTRQWALLNGAFYAGFSPDSGQTQDLSGLYTGLEYTHSLNISETKGEALNIHVQLGYDYFVNSADFGLGGQSVQPLEEAFDIGISFSRSNKPFRFWFLEFERLGLTYSIGEDGKFRAITLVTRSWFRK